MPSANGIRTSVVNKRVYSVEKRENDRVYSLLYLEGKRFSYILSRTHLTLYHPLRSLYSDILPRPGTTVIFAEECSDGQAFHLYKQKANQINEYGKIDISDKNT